jgi:hypothetical protein
MTIRSKVTRSKVTPKNFRVELYPSPNVRDWRCFDAFAAFLVALFTEMYGFPLTIYLLSGWLGGGYPGLDLLSHNNGHLLLTRLGWSGDPHLSSLSGLYARMRMPKRVEYEGVVYYLCCPLCQAEFGAAPERWAWTELGEKVKARHSSSHFRPVQSRYG